MDRNKVNRKGGRLTSWCFRVAQAIVGKDRFEDGGEGIVVGERSELFVRIDKSP
jgi:hypothetical protein